MRNQENPKNNVSSKQYFEAGGGEMVGAGKGCERKKTVSGEGWEGNDLENNFLTLLY